MVPARFVPRVEPTFVNLTVTVHDAPGASVVPVQLSGPASGPTRKKYVNREPPLTDTLLTVTEALPAAAVLVRVAMPVPLPDPLGSVMVNGEGEIPTVAGFAPVPLRATGEPVTVAPVAATVREPL